MRLQLLNQCSFRCNLTNYPAFKRALFFAACSALCLPSSISAQSFAYTNLSNNAQPRPATDGTYVVTTDTLGDIIVYPFAGGTSTTLVPIGATLPNGLGAATSFTAFGVPDLISNLVYFGAQSASGSGYYSVPVTGGSIHVIVDNTLQDPSGRSVGAAALPLEVAPSYYFNGSPLSIPGIGSNLFVSPSGDATFTANLTSTTAPQGDLAILKLSTSGTLSSAIDTNTLSGCTRISNFATDGSILAVWALSTTNDLLLLESNGPNLSCSDVLLDLGVPGTVATGILPGQPSSGSIQEEFISPSTVIDSGYIYFSATMTLTDATINSGTYGGNVGYYGGIFRIRPGGSIERIIATDNPQLATLSPFFGPFMGTTPLLICGSFAVRGNDLVFATGWLDHYSWPGGVFPLGVFFFDQGAGTLQTVYAQGVALSPNIYPYAYSGVAPTEAALSADSKFAFEVGVEAVASIPYSFYPVLYTVVLTALPVPALNLSSSASGATPATTVTLTATAVGVTGEAVPTGTVTFFNGTASLGTSTLNSMGIATLAVQNLPIGTDSITAMYAGDANYSSVGSATTTINVAAMSTFSLSSSSTSLTIAQGQSGTATISLAPVGGFSAPVQFSCSGLPQYATCTFAPTSITPGASVAKTTMTIATNLQTSELVWPSGLSYAAVLLLGLGAIRRARNGLRRMSVPLFMILMAVVGAAVGCGGSSGMSHVTPAGVSTVVVSATSGTTVQTVSVTVTIAQN